MNAVEFMDAENEWALWDVVLGAFSHITEDDVMNLFGWREEKLLVMKETAYIDLGWLLCEEEQVFS